MVELKIFWTKTAINQRNLVFEYWNARNKNTSYSKKLNNTIIDRTEILKSNPFLGKITDFENTRILPIKHYSILYQKHKTKIIITGFWDNRQNPKKLLSLLKAREI